MQRSELDNYARMQRSAGAIPNLNVHQFDRSSELGTLDEETDELYGDDENTTNQEELSMR